MPWNSKQTKIRRPDAADLLLVERETEKETLTANVNAELIGYLVEHLSPSEIDAWVESALLNAFRRTAKAGGRHATRETYAAIGRAGALKRWSAQKETPPKPVARILLTEAAHARYMALGPTPAARQIAFAARVSAAKGNAVAYAPVVKPARMVRVPTPVRDALFEIATRRGVRAQDVASGILTMEK